MKLKFYRLQKISEGSAALDHGAPGTLKGSSDVGTVDRFRTEFTSTDELVMRNQVY